MSTGRSPGALGRADVRRCGTLWYASASDNAKLIALPRELAIRPVRPSDTAALRRAMLAACADNPDLATIRVNGQRLGFLAEAESTDGDARQVLAYGWIAQAGDTVDDLGFPLEMPASEGWIYDCATVPDARGRGLYTALLRAMLAALPRHGLERAWIGTAPQNWPSQRGIARAGFQKVADIDWTGTGTTVYGVPGMPDAVLYVLAATMADEGQARVVPDAGIPWIEAILTPGSQPDAGDALPGLKRFRQAYGDELHWTTHAAEAVDATPATVTLKASSRECTVSATATFEAYERALAEVAPGLPQLGDDD